MFHGLDSGYILARSMSVHTSEKIVFGSQTWMGMVLHLIVVHDTGVVVAVGICPFRTQVINNNNAANTLV